MDLARLIPLLPADPIISQTATQVHILEGFWKWFSSLGNFGFALWRKYKGGAKLG